MKFFKPIFALAIASLILPTATKAGSLGTLNESISVGRSLSIGLDISTAGGWSASNNTNPDVASINVANTSAAIKGLTPGYSVITICDGRTSNCLDVKITVSGVLGASTGLAFNSNYISQSDIERYGHTIGTWVKEGFTVYYITSNGLIPVPTYKIFLSNGGTNSKVKVINKYDLARPMLSLLSEKDSRVK